MNRDCIIVAILSAIIALGSLFFSIGNREGFSTPKELGLNERAEMFKKFRDMYPIVFKNGKSRNSGGFAFFKYLVDLDMPADKFSAYNQMYCGVSGAVVSPQARNGRKNFDYIKIKDVDGNPVWGKYYRCCDPCCADLMREDKTAGSPDGSPNTVVEDYTHVHNNKKTNFKVLTIANPCPGYANLDESPDNQKFKKSFDCLECGNDGRTKNGVYSKSGRLIVAVLFPVENVSESVMQENYNMLMEKYKSRLSKPYTEAKGGMGDIFIRVSVLGKQGA